MAHHVLEVVTAAIGALLAERDPRTDKPSADAHKGYWAYDLEGGTMAAGDTVTFTNNGKILALGRIINFRTLEEYEWAAGFRMQCSRANSVVFKWEDVGGQEEEEQRRCGDEDQAAQEAYAKAQAKQDPPPGLEKDRV